MIIQEEHLKALLNARYWHPHEILGMHPFTENGHRGLIARALIRGAHTCEVVDVATDQRFALKRIADEGMFEGTIMSRQEVFKYRLRVQLWNGEIRQFYDPYCFLPTLSNQDLYLFNEGTEHRAYHKLGSTIRSYDGVQGVSFAVWAPSAQRVSVVGEFNGWDGRYHPMRALGSSGVWELFIPGLGEGEYYKYELLDAQNFIHLKTDPYGDYFEPPPHNAAIVKDVEQYEWSDQEWIEERARTNWKEEPVSIYEVHLGSWRRKVEDGQRPLTYRELADELTAYVLDMGYTHVEMMPVAEHPFNGSWGYQVTGYFAPTQRFGEPEDFQYLVDTLHQNGIGVIVDWVPAHFPTDAFALARFDGSAVYEHEDPRQGYHHDWGTFIPNFGRHEVRSFLIASALAWFDHYHVDGLRVDAVASMLYLDYSRKEGEWVPNAYGGNENLEAISFLKEVNRLIHEYYPGSLMIAEESTAFTGVTKPTEDGGLGFDFKWNMGWMHDTLEYFSKDPIYRKYHHNNITFGMIYQFSENFVQCFSHDEVVHGKGSLLNRMGAGTISEKAANLRALYGLMWAWPGKKTLFMGQEFGQSREWDYDHSLDWHLLQYLDHAGLQMLVRDLNKVYREEPGLSWGDSSSAGFEWIALEDADSSVYAFLRKSDDPADTVLVVCHYTPAVRYGYRVGVPMGGFWREVINTDAEVYGGQGHGNMGGCDAEQVEWNGRPFSLSLNLPGVSTLVLKWEG